ncbi:MAG: AAA family ATPase [Solirubrobacteraceae bacterium]|nr:AAA family ATPase [Solirubrobacteraceae bacterium]
MTAPVETPLRRRDIHPGPVVDGRRTSNGTRTSLGLRLREALISRGEREDADVEARLHGLPGVTRPNTVALISPKGGVGKTTATFVVGDLLSSHLKLRVVAVDANPDFGTLARLGTPERLADRSLADLLEDADRIRTAAELNAYVSRQPSGLHVLAAPRDAELTASLGPERYGELVAFLSCFYEVVLLDLGTGVAGPLARFAVERADQVVLVTTPEWVTSSVVLDALGHLKHERTTVVVNKSILRGADVSVVEQRFRAEQLHRSVTIPLDNQLASMLDCGRYTLGALERPTRVAIKRLGLGVGEQLL